MGENKVEITERPEFALCNELREREDLSAEDRQRLMTAAQTLVSDYPEDPVSYINLGWCLAKTHAPISQIGEAFERGISLAIDNRRIPLSLDYFLEACEWISGPYLLISSSADEFEAATDSLTRFATGRGELGPDSQEEADQIAECANRVLALMRRSLELVPENSRIWTGIATAAALVFDDELCIQAFHRAIDCGRKEGNEDASVHWALAGVYMKEKNDTAAAGVHLREACRIEPNNTMCLSQLFACLMDQASKKSALAKKYARMGAEVAQADAGDEWRYLMMEVGRVCRRYCELEPTNTKFAAALQEMRQGLDLLESRYSDSYRPVMLRCPDCPTSVSFQQ